MTFSFAVTAYNESTRSGPGILKCIEAAVQHPDISEIIIVDDSSFDYNVLARWVEGISKVKLFRNKENLGVFGNKLAAVSKCSGDWVINSDSDNVFYKASLDVAMSQDLDEKTWYCPSFARPEFDYRDFIGRYDHTNAASLARAGGMGDCLVNTGNQMVNRESFMEVFEKYLYKRADQMMPNYLNFSGRHMPRWRDVFNACDSLIFNYEWLKSGGALEVVKYYEYDHYFTVGLDSNYNRAPAEKTRLSDTLLGLMGELT